MKHYPLETVNPSVPMPENFETPCMIFCGENGVELTDEATATQESWDLALTTLIEMEEEGNKK